MALDLSKNKMDLSKNKIVGWTPSSVRHRRTDEGVHPTNHDVVHRGATKKRRVEMARASSQHTSTLPAPRMLGIGSVDQLRGKFRGATARIRVVTAYAS